MMSEIYAQSKQKQSFSGLNILMGIFPQHKTTPISSRRCQNPNRDGLL